MRDAFDLQGPPSFESSQKASASALNEAGDGSDISCKRGDEREVKLTGRGQSCLLQRTSSHHLETRQSNKDAPCVRDAFGVYTSDGKKWCLEQSLQMYSRASRAFSFPFTCLGCGVKKLARRLRSIVLLANEGTGPLATCDCVDRKGWSIAALPRTSSI